MEKQQNHRVYRLVLTGGPCGGKTTGQARVCSFFESLDWKVFRVPEAATLLIGGGVQFADLSHDEAVKFQENLLKTMIQIENTFFDLATTCQKNCLVICDRGVMDASAYIDRDSWERIMKENGWSTFELRENRYNQIVHMVTSANGAEAFYTTQDHRARTENLELARVVDERASGAWLGHPYFDLIDNSTDFENKIIRLISTICKRMELDTGDRLKVTAKKYKFLVRGELPADAEFPSFQDFEVTHHYLAPNATNKHVQDRLRKRGKDGNYLYILTSRSHVAGQTIDVKKQLTKREYELYLATKVDLHHFPVEKTRRCFIIQNQYFQLDVYKKPENSRCQGLILMETYSSLDLAELEKGLPPFLRDVVNVTGKPEYSMFNLSLRDESYDAKFYKYAAHGNKGGQPQPPNSLLSHLNGHNNHHHHPHHHYQHSPTPSTSSHPHHHEQSANGHGSPPSSLSPVSPSSDDVLMSLSATALRRTAQNGSTAAAAAANANNGQVAAKCCSNGFNGSSFSSDSNGAKNESANGSPAERINANGQEEAKKCDRNNNNN